MEDRDKKGRFVKGHISFCRKRKEIEKICACGKKFIVPLYRKNIAKFCSIRCLRKYRIYPKTGKSIKGSLAKLGNKNPMYGTHHTEEWKRKMSEVHKGKGHPMSVEARRKLSLNHKGKHSSPQTEFKGNKKSDEVQKLRQGLEYRLWQVAVYKRDNFRCRNCGKKCSSKQLVAHHLFSFNDYPELRFAINNGLTLCRSCHYKIHNPSQIHRTRID